MKNFSKNETVLMPGPDNRARIVVSSSFAGVAYGLEAPGEDGKEEFDTGLFAEDVLLSLRARADKEPREAFDSAAWSLGASDKFVSRTELPICSVSTAQMLDKTINVSVLGDCRALVLQSGEVHLVADRRPERWGHSMLETLRAEMATTGKSFADAKKDLLPIIRRGIELIGTEGEQPWYFMPDPEVAAEIVTESFPADKVDCILLYNRGLQEGSTVFAGATGASSEKKLLAKAQEDLVGLCKNIEDAQDDGMNAETFRFTLQNDIAAALLSA